jgi:hypothetical protein
MALCANAMPLHHMNYVRFLTEMLAWNWIFKAALWHALPTGAGGWGPGAGRQVWCVKVKYERRSQLP